MCWCVCFAVCLLFLWLFVVCCVSWGVCGCGSCGYWFGSPLDSPPPDRPKFRSFFSVSHHQFRSFSLSLCVFSLNFGGFCEDRDVHVWALGLWCETPAASGQLRLRELQTCTFDGPGASKLHQKTTRTHTVSEKKSETGGGRRKKREILGPPPFGAPPFGAPPFGASFFLGLGPTLGPSHRIGQKWDWPKLDWPKLVKSGWPKRDRPKSVPSL